MLVFQSLGRLRLVSTRISRIARRSSGVRWAYSEPWSFWILRSSCLFTGMIAHA
jgi:hypothetical protein